MIVINKISKKKLNSIILPKKAFENAVFKVIQVIFDQY